MFVKIALTMRRVHLTDEDLKIAAEACEMLANRYRNDAKGRRTQSCVQESRSMPSAVSGSPSGCASFRALAKAGDGTWGPQTG